MPSQNSVKTEGLQINCIVKGFIWSLIITIFLSILASLLLQFTSLSETLLSGFSAFIFVVSMFLGAVIGARAAGGMGLIHGLAVTLLYWALLFIISLIWGLEPFSFLHMLKRFVLSLATGIVGGIIGIGLSQK